MIIGCDIDGVLADFTSAYKKLYPHLDFTQPGVMNEWYFERAAGATPQDEKRAWTQIKESNTFWEELEPLPEARELLAQLDNLRDEGHEIYFITNRTGLDCKGQTWRWLKRWGFRNPTVLVTPGSKAAICEGLAIDVLIDDKPDNLDDLPDLTRGYLVDAPHNQYATTDPGVRRVAGGRNALELEGLFSYA